MLRSNDNKKESKSVKIHRRNEVATLSGYLQHVSLMRNIADIFFYVQSLARLCVEFGAHPRKYDHGLALSKLIAFFASYFARLEIQSPRSTARYFSFFSLSLSPFSPIGELSQAWVKARTRVCVCAPSGHCFAIASKTKSRARCVNISSRCYYNRELSDIFKICFHVLVQMYQKECKCIKKMIRRRKYIASELTVVIHFHFYT